MWSLIVIIIGVICTSTAIYFLVRMLKAVPENKDVPEVTSIAEAGQVIDRRHIPKAESWLEKQLEDIQSRSNTKSGVVSNWWETKKSESSAKLDRALADQITTKAVVYRSDAVVEESKHYLERVPIRLKHQDETDDNLHESQNASFENTIAITKNATANGLSLENEKTRQVTGIELEKKLKESEIELQMERVRSEIKRDEHREIKQIDLEVHREETAIDVQAAIVARVPEQFEVELLTQRLFKYHDQKETLLLEPDSEAKQKKMKRLDKNIRKLEKAIDGRSEGLIQGNKRPELRGLEES